MHAVCLVASSQDAGMTEHSSHSHWTHDGPAISPLHSEVITPYIRINSEGILHLPNTPPHLEFWYAVTLLGALFEDYAHDPVAA
ncbi:hypothetical protein A0H81_07284 [Grifola frondosa]|uniref:Uncharacterized protein n=1 Tax=Grifola frondosa TaxID=5627 RepID=A0A1C7M898_GRIFR|nr:hypothetical protein A0H81_07284 [Grifola frondosa]